ncbi:MAG: hypothetical protein IJ572_00780 [Bacilli bacterium]|nr:hypothetical protein [Bacilli bacterium]
MKKIFKNPLFTFIIGTVIFSAVSVLAYSIVSSNVGFTPKDSSWEVENVSEALDDLYDRTNSIALKKICRYVDSEYGDESDHFSVGTKYECDPGDNIKRNFYVLEVRDNSVDLIMERNITESNISWKNAKHYFESGAGSALNWKYVQVIKMPDIQQIVNAVDYPTWKYEDKANTGWFCMGLKDQSSCAQGNWTYASEAGKAAVKPYRWLFNYLSDCSPFGCDPTTELDSNSAKQNGYWTNDFIFGYSEYWCISRGGLVNNCNNSSIYGLRPVITVSKTNFR